MVLLIQLKSGMDLEGVKLMKLSSRSLLKTKRLLHHPKMECLPCVKRVSSSCEKKLGSLSCTIVITRAAAVASDYLLFTCKKVEYDQIMSFVSRPRNLMIYVFDLCADS